MLLERCLELLAPLWAATGAVHLDATLGLGGHAEAVLSAHPDGHLIGLDRDTEALALAGAGWPASPTGSTWCTPSTTRLPEVLERCGIAGLTARCSIWVCPRCNWTRRTGGSPTPGRAAGHADGPDAGRDRRRGGQHLPHGELARVLRVYGEEKFAGRIAAAIVRERAKAPITSSARLAELVRDAIPAAARRTGGHPAKRTFQALRIEVNGELAVLERRCQPRSTRSFHRDDWLSCPTNRWRTSWSSERWSRGPGQRLLLICPLSPKTASRRLGC